ncbi:hypothetical protein GCM10023188_36640 [Pontibacter saemangeumensis]|uniref:DUF3800 domain-containing protein n=1 Tax=Pontibacter saemangeumensis TaxID=1084525 RepID=A0ABP8LZZ8_9BACT
MEKMEEGTNKTNQEIEGHNEEIEEQDIIKLEKLENERKELLNRVVSGNIINIRDRVAYILNNSIDARNSDIDLAWSYWKCFESNKFDGVHITKEQFGNLTRLSSLSRIRAKIQNEYKLFQADDTVKRYRGVLEEDKKNQAIEDKPRGLGMYSVYIDETGKTQSYLSVGSLWILEAGASLILSNMELGDWKRSKKVNYEFHFAELDRFRVALFKDFFTKFLTLHPAISFKLIVVNNKGFSDKNAAITDLTYHLLSKGVDHENETGRAPLPRVLQVWLDEEEKGSDELKIENIKERITSQKIEGLHLGDFQSVSSDENFYIQVVDLFTGAINRKLHNPNGSNFKDDFADYVIDSLGFDMSSINKENNQVDHSTVFNLRQQEVK